MTENQKNHFIIGFFIGGEFIKQIGRTPIWCTHKTAEGFVLFWEALLKGAFEKLPEGTYIAYDYLNPTPTPSELEQKRDLEKEQKEWKEFCRTAEYYLNRINVGFEQHKKHRYIEKYRLGSHVKAVFLL